jgi:tetratricopeptide (TPR) repeat protein
MQHPQTQDFARRMQSVPRTSRGFQSLMPEVRNLRTTLMSSGDNAGLAELAEKVRLWAPGEKAPAVTARALAEAADLLGDAGMWDRAAQLLERAVQANPLDISVVDRAWAILSRGKAFEELHDVLTAHAHLLDRSTPNDPTQRARCWQRVGKLRAERLFNIDAAIAAYDTAIQIEPEISVIRELASLLESRGRPDDRDGAADLYCLLGELLGGDEGALCYARALTLNPDHADALAQAGVEPPPRAQPASSFQSRGPGAPAQRPAAARHSAPAAANARQSSPSPSMLPQPSPFTSPFAPAPSALAAAPGYANHGESVVAPLPWGSVPGQVVALSQPQPPVLVPMQAQPPVVFPINAPSPVVMPLGTPAAFPSQSGRYGGDSRFEATVLDQREPMPSSSLPARAHSVPPRVQPVMSAPSFPPSGYESGGFRGHPAPENSHELAPSTTDITWTHDTSSLSLPKGFGKKSRSSSWPRHAILLGALLGVGVVAAVKRDAVHSLYLRTSASLLGTHAAPLDEVQGSARSTPLEATPAPAAALPSTPEPAPAPAPEAKPAPEQAPAPAVAEPAKSEKPKGTVSLVTSALKVTGGRIAKPALSQSLDSALMHLDACYAKALAKKPKLHGKLAFSWNVKPTGKVDRVKKSSDSLNDGAALKCVVRALEQEHFPKPKGGVAHLKAAFAFGT